MTEDRRADPTKRSKRMLAFYVAMGVVVALFVAGFLAWTPLRIWYWQQQAESAGNSTDRAHALASLVAVGPQSRNALQNLLRDHPELREEARPPGG